MQRPRPFVVHEDDCELEGWSDPAHGPVRWRTLVSADRTPTEALTVGVVEIDAAEAGDSVVSTPHRHAQAEVYYVLSGRGVVTIDGTDHPVDPGSTVFIPGGAAHRTRSLGPGSLRLLYAFAADSFEEIRYEFGET